MSELETSRAVDIISTICSADISAVMDEIGSRIGVQLEGEVQDLAGVLNLDAAYAVGAVENARNVAVDGDWGYYAKQLARQPGQLLKFWVRWNGQEAVYDYYLEADPGEVFDHATPYIGTLH